MKYTAVAVFVVMAAILGMTGGTAQAVPSSNVTYTETASGGGWWQYDAVFHNTGDPVADTGYDLYDVLISFDPLATFNWLSYAGGWDGQDGFGFAEAYSLNIGAPPAGTDIAPGESLGGFSFEIDTPLASLPFCSFLENPFDQGNPVPYCGTAYPTGANTVPEPGTWFLMGTGLVGLAAFRKRFARK